MNNLEKQATQDTQDEDLRRNYSVHSIKIQVHLYVAIHRNHTNEKLCITYTTLQLSNNIFNNLQKYINDNMAKYHIIYNYTKKILIAKKTEDTKGVIKIPEAVNRRTDNTMAKRESDFSAYYIQHNYL